MVSTHTHFVEAGLRGWWLSPVLLSALFRSVLNEETFTLHKKKYYQQQVRKHAECCEYLRHWILPLVPPSVAQQS